jgi:glutamine amidotransferase
VIGVIDYRAGNLRSVRIGLERAGAEVRTVSSPDDLGGCAGLVLPGVGAFGQGMANLASRSLVEPVLDWIRADRPFLGICLGLQLLFEASEELGLHKGLGALRGRVVRLPPGVKVPQIGWNSIERAARAERSPYSEALPEGEFYYFNNSFVARPSDAGVVLAETDYGGRFSSVVGRGRMLAVQFHPEKSARAGLALLRCFVDLVGGA